MDALACLYPLRFRTVWISDVHLGTKWCKAPFLLDFLKSTESEFLYLVGDVIDLCAMRRGLFWPEDHNAIVQVILDKAHRGTQVTYIPGNHDALLRAYDGITLGNVRFKRQARHVTADGRRLLILHGDELDKVIRCSRLLAHIGDRTYSLLLRLNRLVNLVRRRLGLPYWSLAAYLKLKTKKAVNVISAFEREIAHEAARSQADGLVCGHIHHAEIRTIEGVLYCNDGDWVESCTALAEAHDGSLHIIHWADAKQTYKSHPGRAISPALQTA